MANLEDSYPDIIKEWNYEKNKELHPKQFSSHSGKKFGGNVRNVDLSGSQL